MDYSGKGYTDRGSETQKKPARIFLFHRKAANRGNSVAPFTEMPEEIRRGRLTLGMVLQFLLNVIFFAALVLSLIALVAAFGYQMIHHPNMLSSWVYNQTNTVVTFIQSLVAAH